MTQAKHTPEIHILINQTQREQYQVRVADPAKRQIIFKQQISHNASDLQAQYTNYLLEGRVEGDRQLELTRYGKRLYQQLFGDGKLLKKYFSGQETGARFVLRLDESAAELWNAPWEYIHDGKRFVLFDGRHTFVRTPSLDRIKRKAIDSSERPSPLRILIFFSAPERLGSLDIDNEAKLILDAFDEAVDQKRVVIDIVEEGTLFNLQQQLQLRDYHIIHYSGHGGNHQGRSFLAFEGLGGGASPVYIEDLVPIIQQHAPNLRLIMLSGCQTGQIDETEAVNALATGLLHEVPAIVAMQFSINDDSATTFAKAFYTGISQGETVERSMALARQAIRTHKRGLNDWGVPALYIRSRNIRLIDAGATPEAVEELPQVQFGHLSRPELFVGRRPELRQLRQALSDPHANIMMVWGVRGSGKSALVGRLLERPGAEGVLENTLVIDCHNTSPVDIPNKIVAWLYQQGCEEAIRFIHKSSLPVTEMIIEACAKMEKRSFAIVLDGFDALLQGENGHWVLPNQRLADFLAGLAQGLWYSRVILTSRYYWIDFNQFENKHNIHVQLKNMDIPATYRIARRLPSIIDTEPQTQWTVGLRSHGHPQTLHLIDRYLHERIGRAPKGADKKVIKWLEDKELDTIIEEDWERHALPVLLAQLSEQEREFLDAISVLSGKFWEEHVSILTQTTEEIALQVMAKLEILSLIQYEYTDDEGDNWYTLQPVVRKIVYEGLHPKAKKRYLMKAVRMAAQFFIDTATEHFAERGQKMNSNDVGSISAMFIRALLSTYIGPMAQGIMQQALLWHHYLYEAEEYDQAAGLVQYIWPFLYEWGDQKYARTLIDKTVDSASGEAKGQAQVSLAEFLVQEGEIERAKTIYDNAYAYFDKKQLPERMAFVMGKQAAVLMLEGKHRRAQRLQEKALAIYEKEESDSGAFEALVHLVAISITRKDYRQALDFSDRAEEVARRTSDYRLLAQLYHEQAQIWIKLENLGRAIRCLKNSLDLSSQFQGKWQICRSLALLGTVLLMSEDLDGAKKTFLESLALAQKLEQYAAVGERYLDLGDVYQAEGNSEEAEIHYQRATEILREHGTDVQQREAKERAKKAQKSGRWWFS